jgi:hypothetical protein
MFPFKTNAQLQSSEAGGRACLFNLFRPATDCIRSPYSFFSIWIQTLISSKKFSQTYPKQCLNNKRFMEFRFLKEIQENNTKRVDIDSKKKNEKN